MLEKKSGAQVGAENLQKVRDYLSRLDESGAQLPVRAGKLNMTAIARDIGVDRQVLYTNSRCRGLIDQAASRQGVSGIEQRDDNDGEGTVLPPPSDLRIMRLEQELLRQQQTNAALKAESLELRRQLQRLKHIEDHMVETGRRVAR